MTRIGKYSEAQYNSMNAGIIEFFAAKWFGKREEGYCEIMDSNAKLVRLFDKLYFIEFE